jgi:Family of unknown function (DUF5681)
LAYALESRHGRRWSPSRLSPAGSYKRSESCEDLDLTGAKPDSDDVNSAVACRAIHLFYCRGGQLRYRTGGPATGNPNGRPQGSRNAATLALESLLDGQAEALTQKAIDLALAGDLVALRICLDRILPSRKDRPVAFEIPPITTIEDAPKVMAAVTAAVAQGGLTVREASDVAQLVEAYVRSVEASDLEKRLRAIEENLK